MTTYCLVFVHQFWNGNMGAKPSMIAHRIDHAQKTGTLSLEDLKLVAIPEQISQIDKKRIKSMSITNNAVKELPGHMFAFTMLKTLALDNNQLSMLPRQLSQLDRLESLSLNRNLIVLISSEMFLLPRLKKLMLANNKIKTFPRGIGGLKKLQEIDLSNNLIKSFPNDIAECVAEEINLNRNQIAIIPSAMKDCSRLKVLRLDENCVDVAGVPGEFLKESKVVLIALEANPVKQRQLQSIEGYDEYEKRFTSTKRKMGN
eukprot:m.186608 g.186608  ORF g.186608 m.186608 type:complete len:259 (-) comp32275_c1_seq3:288-1064(-)